MNAPKKEEASKIKYNLSCSAYHGLGSTLFI
jgi:hypothetical protein